jgi:hypothetical protein
MSEQKTKDPGAMGPEDPIEKGRSGGDARPCRLVLIHASHAPPPGRPGAPRPVARAGCFDLHDKQAGERGFGVPFSIGLPSSKPDAGALRGRGAHGAPEIHGGSRAGAARALTALSCG